MKKIYQIPAMQVTVIELQQMIAMSNLGSTLETSGNLGRRGGSVWDDEEEE